MNNSIYLRKALILVILLIILPMDSYCCSCIGGQYSIQDELKNTNVVLVGKILKKDTINIYQEWSGDSLQQAKYTIKILSVYKGNVNKSINIIIITGLGNGDCGFQFEIEKNYIIYADYKNKYLQNKKKVPRYLYTNICKRTSKENITEIRGIERLRKLHR